MPFDPTDFAPAETTNLVLDVLLAGYARIEDQEHWCKIRFRDHLGRYCADGALSPEAAKNITGGAEFHQRLSFIECVAYNFLDLAAQSRAYASITEANDAKSTTHAHILEIYRDAIERARGRQT